MDDLFMLAGDLLENNNYKKEDVYDSIPDGTYDALFEGATLKKSDEKGTEWFSLRFNIVGGDYNNRKEFVSLFLTEKTVKRTLSTIMKLIDALGYEVNIEAFSDKKTILEVLKEMSNSNISFVKKTSGGGFVTYSFLKEGENE